MQDTPNHSPTTGRLILVLENTLSLATKTELKRLLTNFSQHPTHPTFVASLAKPAFLGAVQLTAGLYPAGFYNAADTDLDLPTTLSLLPWHEVWLVSRGHSWCTQAANAGAAIHTEVFSHAA